MKILKYFLQSLIIYNFYLIILILGLYFSRKLFSCLFKIFGPLIRSNEIIKSNLLKINKNYKNDEIEKISKKMWNNYSKIFVEYIFLSKFKKQNDQKNILDARKTIEQHQNRNQFIFPVLFSFVLSTCNRERRRTRRKLTMK